MSGYGRWEKAVGEPDAGNLPVRFDEGAVETGMPAKRAHGAPPLYSTNLRSASRSARGDFGTQAGR